MESKFIEMGEALLCLIWGKIQFFPEGPEESPEKVKKSSILWVKV
jgi:hypothetical protein